MNKIPSGQGFIDRISSLDVLRGIVMVIMALDHVRDFLYKADISGAAAIATDPTNLATTTPVLFFTRWITHFCAPVFVFLTGTSAWLMSRHKTKGEVSRFLILRGLWLVVVELLIIGLGWSFNPFYNLFFLQVIWAIGVSMVILGLLVHLPYKVILAIGLIIVFGHNILQNFVPAAEQGFLTDLLYSAQFDFYNITEGHSVIIIYAFPPWTGVMLLGYCFGRLYSNGFSIMQRRKLFIGIGSALVVLFLILRYTNLYGDPVPWSAHPRGPVYTFLSFLNVNKYPPSLLFLCVTLGPALIMLAFLEKWKNRFTAIMSTFGAVPLFYYILHFYLIHVLVVIAFYAKGYTSKDIASPGSPFLFRPPDFGFPLLGVYLIWLLVVISLYPLCKKYKLYKATHRKWWLSYL